MYNRFQLAIKYCSYWVNASNGRGHGIHSPFVYEFVSTVLRGRDSNQKAFQHIEHTRKKLMKDESIINILDLGAGSVKGNSKERSIASIAKSAAKPAKFGRLFFRILRHYEIESVLELGTSLGLSTRYFASAEPVKEVITIEGAPELANFTRRRLDEEGYSNVNLLEGDFENLLPKVLPEIKGRKLIFVDGNHRYGSTMAYFHQILRYVQEDDILVFDDIHWSAEMEKAWTKIINHEQVACTIDLFFIGIVFFRTEFKEKRNFSVRF